MRPKQVANRPLVLLLTAMVVGMTILVAFHHHPTDCRVGSESGHPDRSLGGDCVVCRLVETATPAAETLHTVSGPAPDGCELASAPAKAPANRSAVAGVSRAPPA